MADGSVPASATAAATALPTNVSLRIITLAHGSNREDDLSLVVPLDTKIMELKERLRQLVSGEPTPEQLRLIYQGRALLDNSATLRSILRLQAADQIAHVLHLVVRSNTNTLPDSSQSAATGSHQSAPSAPSAPQTLPQTQQNLQIPQVPQGHAMPNHLQTMMNPAQFLEQANFFQQHMAIHNQQLANIYQGMPHPVHQQVHQRHGIQTPSPHAAHAPASQNPPTAIPANHHPMTGAPQPVPTPPLLQHAHHHVNQSATTMRIRDSIGPNGERVRVFTNSTGPVTHYQINHTLRANPVERSASAPGSAERAGTPIPPEPHRMHQNPPMIPTAPQMPLRQQQIPQLIPNPATAPNPAVQNASPTVWLLSSPAGPQALLFSPEHGYFTSTPTLQPLVQHVASPVTVADRVSQTQQEQQNVQQRPGAPDRPPLQPGAQVIVRPPGQPPAPANAPARPQNAAGADVAAFVVQRGWLFLRLYMFIFVLSEPGTWRRIILLGIATFVCFLPRRNPLTDAFNVARQHFDNLIGPPQPPAQPLHRPQQARQPGPMAGGNQPGVNPPDQSQNGGIALPSLEEQARRTLQNRQDQNPGFIRGLLYPIEQALALFLASLIPGVGERHVQAREQARRILAEEQERRQREAEEQASQQANNTETHPENTDPEIDRSKNEPATVAQASELPNQTTATSSGVEVSTASNAESHSSSEGNVRQRTGVGNHDSPSATAE